MRQVAQRKIVEKPKPKQKKERNPYLRLLSDEELDVLEMIAKKATREIHDSH